MKTEELDLQTMDILIQKYYKSMIGYQNICQFLIPLIKYSYKPEDSVIDGLDPTFYLTGSYEEDLNLIKDINEAIKLFNDLEDEN